MHRVLSGQCGRRGPKLGPTPMQRQSTLDCRYLTLLCDNLKKRMFLQNFFPNTILGICYVFPAIHIIPLQLDKNIRSKNVK
jgi:hypothetical protein